MTKVGYCHPCGKLRRYDTGLFAMPCCDHCGNVLVTDPRELHRDWFEDWEKFETVGRALRAEVEGWTALRQNAVMLLVK